MRHRRAVLHSSSRTVLYAFGYVFLEWLFFATKPSFLTAHSFLDQLRALLVGAVPFVAGALLLHLLVLALAWADARTNSGRSPRLGRLAPFLIPSAITAVTGLILFDNFTYTAFGWGLVHARWTRPLYLVGLGAVFILHLRSASRDEKPVSGTARVWPGAVLAGVLLLSAAIGIPLSRPEATQRVGTSGSARPGSLPNIIMFASDGVPASRLSAYGYRRKTTPNLDQYLDRAFVVENAFTNSCMTTGSVTSMFTGMYPATTKLLDPPYVLEGKDAYRTLPRILRSMGYRTLQQSVRYYADGPDLNWREAFDYANDRKVETKQEMLSRMSFQLPSIFLARMSSRLSERLLHVLLIRTMVDRHALVTVAPEARSYGLSDHHRMNQVLAFIDRGPGPFFIHIHLMGTHCCRYSPEHRTFSAGSFDSEEEKNSAALDDAILGSDRSFGLLMDHLNQHHLLENTIVVYSSDHTNHWGYQEQVPLVFLFPKGDHKGRLSTTAQLLDVAPTLLDYLKLPIPPWMEGKSLLGGALPPLRPVFTIAGLATAERKTGEMRGFVRITVDSMGPPTYGLRAVGMVVCQRWYKLRLETGEVTSGPIPTYSGACPEADLPSDDQARKMMTGYLTSRGFSF